MVSSAVRLSLKDTVLELERLAVTVTEVEAVPLRLELSESGEEKVRDGVSVESRVNVPTLRDCVMLILALPVRVASERLMMADGETLVVLDAVMVVLRDGTAEWVSVCEAVISFDCLESVLVDVTESDALPAAVSLDDTETVVVVDWVDDGVVLRETARLFVCVVEYVRVKRSRWVAVSDRVDDKEVEAEVESDGPVAVASLLSCVKDTVTLIVTVAEVDEEWD